MFVRFPIILARPTSLRGSLSPDLWQKVIGRTPGGVFPWTVSGKQNSGLSCFCCVSGATSHGKILGGAGSVFVLCVSAPVFLLCASHPLTQTPGQPGGSATASPGSPWVLPAHAVAPSPSPPSAAGLGTTRHCTPVRAALLPPSSCLCPCAPRVVPASRPPLPEGYFSMWPIASMFRWAGHSVW